MQERWNPTSAEIRQWAADPKSLCPVEDWDLAITGIGLEELFLELVENEHGHKADFFLQCLFLWVFDAVRVQRITNELEEMLRRGDASKELALRIWAETVTHCYYQPSTSGQSPLAGFWPEAQRCRTKR